MLVGLEMDEKRMTLLLFDGLPCSPPIVLAAHFAAGVGVGVLFFRGLWWNTRLIVGGGGVSTAVALMLTRFLLMGGSADLGGVRGRGVRCWPRRSASSDRALPRLALDGHGEP